MKVSIIDCIMKINKLYNCCWYCDHIDELCINCDFEFDINTIDITVPLYEQYLELGVNI